MKMKCIVIVTVFLGISCTYPKYNEDTNYNKDFVFDSTVNVSWENNDTLIFRQCVYSLRDSSLSDSIFLNRIRILSSLTNFFVGHFELCDSCWINKQSYEGRIKFRKSISDIYSEYVNSDFLFDRDFNYEWSLEAQEKYFDSTRAGKLSSKEYFRLMINDIKQRH